VLIQYSEFLRKGLRQGACLQRDGIDGQTEGENYKGSYARKIGGLP
jgi:hypothetical protein